MAQQILAAHAHAHAAGTPARLCFVEDRLATLEQFDLRAGGPFAEHAVTLALAGWGYTTPADVARAATLPAVRVLARESDLAPLIAQMRGGERLL